jgi:hypothetical protein
VLNIVISLIHQTTMPRKSRKAQHIQALWEVLEERVTESELRMITGRRNTVADRLDLLLL